MKSLSKTILTLHPEGKAGVNILKSRYDLVRTVLLRIIKGHQEISFDQLTDLAETELIKLKFDGRPLWYIVTVKLDLEARNEIERIPKTTPHKLRMKGYKSIP